MSLLSGLAQQLSERGLGVYRSDGSPYQPGEVAILLEHVPQTPDHVVVLTLYGGAEPDSRLGYDEPSLQVRTRASDTVTSRARCEAIRDHLHGLGPVTLLDGTLLLSSVSIQAVPVSMGQDARGRHEHSCNFRLTVRSVTEHRV
ncbi:minor capsid protein [Spirillospora sp. NPDC048911]|uniref:minor capsid protein n=1 Tax=Spirillospora sp. NPDC048911 TaxID=3364527 RepID=UPI003714AB98